MRFMKHSKQYGLIELDGSILKKLVDTEYVWIEDWCEEKLKEYYSRNIK